MTSDPRRSTLAATAWWAGPVIAIVLLVGVAVLLALVSRKTDAEFLDGAGSFEDPSLPGWTAPLGRSIAVDDAFDGTRVLRVTGDGTAAYPGAVSGPITDVAPGAVVELAAAGRRVAGIADGVCRVDMLLRWNVVETGAAMLRFSTTGSFVHGSASLTVPADGSVDALRVLCFIGSPAPAATESWDFDAVTLVGQATSAMRASQAASNGFVLLVATWAVLFGLLAVRFWRRPAVVVGALCLWFAVQNVIAALAAPQASAWVVVSIVVTKEILYVVALLIGLAFVARTAVRRRLSIRQLAGRLQPADWLAIAFILLVGIAFLLSGETVSSRLINARRLASLPVLYLAGRTLVASRSEFSRASLLLVGVAVVVSALGLIELLVLGDAFWRDPVHVLELQSDTISGGIQSALQHARDGLPLNWYTHLIVRMRRLVSTFLEPTTLSIFLALAMTLAPSVLVRRAGPSVVLRLQRGRPVGLRSLPAEVRGYLGRWDAPAAAAMAVMTSAMILTFGKGGWMIVAIAGGTCLLSTTRRTIGRLAAIVVAVSIIVLGVGSALPGVGPNIRAHVDGLISGVVQLLIHPLGTGLGSTGFWGSNLDVGTDSTAGVLASQLGLPGIVLFVGWAALLVYRILPAGTAEDGRRRRADPSVRRALAGALLGLFGLALLSTSATGLLGSAFYLLLGGWMYSLAVRDPWPHGGRRSEHPVAQPRDAPPKSRPTPADLVEPTAAPGTPVSDAV